MERGEHENGDHYYFHHQEFNRLSPERTPLKSPISSTAAARPGTPPLPPSCSPACRSVGGVSYIEHKVSKMDTLAGVAIKYGVEVVDIKRMNGLVTDLQMFALKSLHIPLPGRHPPSPCLSNSSDNQGPSSSEPTPSRRRHSDLFESFQSLKLNSSPPPPPPQRVSPAMSTLQGYYGLKTTHKKTKSEGFETYVSRNGYLEEDAPFAQHSPISTPRFSHHRKSKSASNGFFSETRQLESDKWYNKLIRRRLKSEAYFRYRTPETLLKEDNGSVAGFSSITGNGLALRPSRTASGNGTEPGLMNNIIPLNLMDYFVADSVNGVRKSSSTSSLLHDQENIASSSSTRLTPKWNLKSDLQAFSTAAITRPIFDGLPKPMTGRRNKAALD